MVIALECDSQGTRVLQSPWHGRISAGSWDWFQRDVNITCIARDMLFNAAQPSAHRPRPRHGHGCIGIFSSIVGFDIIAPDRFVTLRCQSGTSTLHANIGSPPFTGRIAKQMGNLEHALSAYGNALRHNPMSLAGLTQVAGIARIKKNYPKVWIRLI